MKVKAFFRKLTGDPRVYRGFGRSYEGRNPGAPLGCYLIDGLVHPERTRWDPKDGELCLARTKPGETLVEVRLDSDVQIDPQSWV